MKRSGPSSGAVPSGFFVLRAPLLPFSVLAEWAAGVEAPSSPDEALDAALERDRSMLLGRLRELAQRPEIREAVFCASPTLDQALAAWLADPASARASGVTNILVRYLSRMAGRATPFGLFSRCGVGKLGSDVTRLNVAPRTELMRHTRLDMHYLTALVQLVERQPEVRDALRLYPSTSLYHLGDSIHYVEAAYEGENRTRSFKLVAVDASDALEHGITSARGGALPAEIARRLAAFDPEIDEATANDFVNELLESQILVSELAPPITGREPVNHVVRCLGERGVGSDVRKTLESVRDDLAVMDRNGVGQSTDGYRAIAERLAPLPAKVDPALLFQVDLAQGETSSTLGMDVLAELDRGLSLLRRLAPQRNHPDIKAFCSAFDARYEGAEVPLCIALDEERGVGFGSTSSVPAPLIEGLPFRRDEATGTSPPSRAKALLTRRIVELSRPGSPAWELSEQDLETLANERPAPLPDSFFVTAGLAAASSEALERGDFRLNLRAASLGGARMFGRFCHGDPALEKAVREHLRAEERLEPDAIFAEIVHLPAGRVGNILCRPVLRPYEIPFMAQPGVEPDHQIGLDDLLVSVSGGRVLLRSKRLNRRVIPRMTTAHNPASTALSFYRFLCAVADQESEYGLAWSWRDLADAPHLPRVTSGKLVLSLESWKISGSEIEGLKTAKGASRFRSAQALRRRLGLPRWLLAHGGGDNFVPVDLDNALSVDNWADMLKGTDMAVVSEGFPVLDEMAAEGPDGKYVCELVVPYVSAREPTESRPLSAPSRIEREFVPGSEWLFVKLYAGPMSVETLLRDVIAPTVRGALERGADRWFCIRYSDPENHLRLRFHGDPGLLVSVIIPELHERCAPWIEKGLVSRIVVDTYRREVERYGGDQGIELCEAIFQEDSEALLRIVSTLGPEAETDARWRLTLVGLDWLLTDLGFDLDGRLGLMRRVRDGFAREHNVDTAFERELGNRFRGVRFELDALLEGKITNDLLGLADGLAALRARSERLAPTVTELQSRERRGLLSPGLPNVAGSLLHMHANRMLIADARAQELVLYDYLVRLYESRAARRRRGT